MTAKDTVYLEMVARLKIHLNSYLFFLLSDKVIQRLGRITEPIVGIIVDTIVAYLEFVNLLFQWFLLVVGELVTELSLEMLCRADSVTDLGLFGLYLGLKSLNDVINICKLSI